MLTDPASGAAEPQEAAPSLTLNLNSNNPFLNPRTGSPALPAQTSPQSAPTRATTTNPFLASFEQDLQTTTLSPPETTMEPPAPSGSPPVIGDDAKELFKRLTVADGPTEGTAKSRTDSSRRGPAPSREPGSHRPNRSDEAAHFKRGPNGLRIPIRPEQRRNRPRSPGHRDSRARRNSDSSTMERPPQISQEEREAREKRRREREAKYRERDESRDSKASEMKPPRHTSSRRRHKNIHVDVVDKLDVTGGLYGVGASWHHDGPFDACRPQRNRSKNTLAPMGAFPTNSANQTIGGSGPINDGTVLEQFHGIQTAEGFNDYAPPPPAPKPFTQISTALVNPVNRVEPVHGEETMGLGTSTFLEGAPASRLAIQRTQSEQGIVDGLSRKKSIAMRLRGMSQSKGRYNEPPSTHPKIQSDKGRFQDRSEGVTLEDGPVQSPLQSPDAPRPSTSRNAENNPFETQHDEAYEKKGASIKIAEASVDQEGGRERSLSSPKRTILERRATTDTTSSTEQKPAGSSFLSRVKSLKGPRRTNGARNPS